MTREPHIYGLLAEFEGPEALVAAAGKVRHAGYRRIDGYAPFPVHHLPEALGLRKTRVPFGVSAVAQAAAVASLAAQDEIAERVAIVVGERARVLDAIRELGAPVVESQANFVWLPMPAAARPLGAYLEQRGVVVRPFADAGVRVTIGAPDENDRLLKLLAAAVGDGVVPAA